MAEWVHAHRAEIEAGHEINLDLGFRTEFAGKMARIMIGENSVSFETDWKWAPNTFPPKLKALAQALRNDGIVGIFATKYQDGKITIQKVTQTSLGVLTQKADVNLCTIQDTLHSIYSTHRRGHPENPDSKQMCCMWSTNDPPDIIEGTEPICDIEDAFGIEISDDEAVELYDMTLDEAARKIIEIRARKS